MKYRSRTEIVCQILETAKELNGVTKIMYSAFLSFTQLKEYVALLLESGLIEHIPDRNTYRTTQKGIAMIQTYQDMHKMIGVEVEQ